MRGGHGADARRLRTVGRRTQGGDHGVRRLRRGDEDHLALVRERQRVETQQVAHRAHAGSDRDGLLLDFDAQARLLGQLGEHGGQATARRVAQKADPRARGVDGRLHESPQRGAVALHGSAEVELAASGEHRHGVVADAAAEDDGVARRARLVAPSSCPTTTSPTPVVVMNRPSQAPRSTTLVSPVTMDTPASSAVAAIDCTQQAQLGDREALLEDEGGGQRQRPRRRRRQVVHRAAHRQAADVAAGKAQRPHHVAVGGEGDAAGRREHGRVVESREHRVAEGRDEDVADQLAVEPAAAAVAEQDAVAALVSHRDPGTCSGRRRRPRC